MPTLYIDSADVARAQTLMASQVAIALTQPDGCDSCGRCAETVAYALASNGVSYVSSVLFECGNVAAIVHTAGGTSTTFGASCTNVSSMLSTAYTSFGPGGVVLAPTHKYRYVKFDFTTTGAVRCQELNIHTVAGQDLPPVQASGSTVVDSGYFYAGFEGWKAFDDSTTTDWWTLANPSASQSWVAVDLGAVESIQYFEVLMSPLSYNLASSVKIYCANLPDFSDQVLVVDKTTDTSKNNVYVVGGPTP